MGVKKNLFCYKYHYCFS